MIIKKIHLENYRSHSNTTVELSKGVNLILGVNGSGKSSILEAIASVLFDTKDRAGKVNGKSFIKHGEKSAKVEITFLGNDGREYWIKNTFHSKKAGTSLLKDCVTEKEYSEKEEIREKLNELCGIQKNAKDLYENLIIAKQNEFITIFKETPTKRAEVFNKIFNTEMYEEMAGWILKKIEDRDSREKERKEAEKNAFVSNLKEETEYESLLQDSCFSQKNLEEENQVFQQERNKLEKEINFYETKRREIERLEIESFNKKEEGKKQKNNIKLEISRARESQRARKVIEETQEEYFHYLKIGETLDLEKKEFAHYQKVQEKNRELLQKKEELSWKIEQADKNLKKLERGLGTKYEKRKKMQEEILSKEEREKSLQSQQALFQKALWEIKQLEEKKGSLEKQFYSSCQMLSKWEQEKAEKKKKIADLEEEKLEEQLAVFEKIKEEAQKKKQEILIQSEKIQLLLESKEKLKYKLCPLLSETCENVGDKNVEEYFQKKCLEEKSKQELLEQDLIELEKGKASENIVWEKKLSYQLFQKEYAELEASLQKERLQSERIQLEIEKENLEGKKILFSLAVSQKEELEEQLQNLVREFSGLGLVETREVLKTLEQEILDEETEQRVLEEERKKNIQQVAENETRIQLGIDEKLFIFKTAIQEKETEQKRLQKGYRLYLENKQISSQLEEIFSKIQREIGRRAELKKERFALEEALFHLKQEVKELVWENLQEGRKKIQEKLLENIQKLATIKEQIKNISATLEEIKKEKEKIRTLQRELDQLKEKLEQTKKIRMNIKAMGPQISKFMLEKISFSASVNFHKITGRTERILWTNENDFESGKENKYAVYLVGENKKIAFEHLSGGEQVAVAISLRETMTEHFSNSKFMILDEPTNNLDTERKKLLAEYMAEILNHLEQSIIVTHDNTFREMAERVIELTEITGKETNGKSKL